MIITSDVDNGTIYHNQPVELTCHTNDTIEDVMYTWTFSCGNFNQSEHSSIITVIATGDPVKYTCIVNSSSGNHGYSSVHISSDGKLYTARAVRIITYVFILMLIKGLA